MYKYLSMQKDKLIKFFKQQSQIVNQSFINFIFPPFCPICESELKHRERLICENCYSHIKTIESNFCRKCGAPRLGGRKTCKYCKGFTFHFSKVRALGIFSSPLVEMIHLLKYDRKTLIAERLGILMGNLLFSDSDLSQTDMIIPVPLHKTRMRERGYNQSLLLSRMVSSITRKELCNDVIIRKKATKSQTTLNHNERENNLKDAFIVSNFGKIKNKTIVVIDDVMTSGTTLNELSKTLLEAGAESVYGLVLARAISV